MSIGCVDTRARSRPAGGTWRAKPLAVRTLILYPAFVLRSSKPAPSGRDLIAQGAAKRSTGSSDLTMRSPNGARFLKSTHAETERDGWRRLRCEGKHSLTSVALRCPHTESRPLGALRLTIPCDPGLNALGYRISPPLGLPGDCVARHGNKTVHKSALLRPSETQFRLAGPEGPVE